MFLIFFNFNTQLDESEMECYVCQETYEVGSTCLKLPCSHCFHKECIHPWLKDHNTCPVCREKLIAPDTDATPTAAPTPSNTSDSSAPITGNSTEVTELGTEEGLD